MTKDSRPLVLVAGLVLAASQAYLIYLVDDLRPNILVLQLTFDANGYWGILGQWGEAGREAYRGHFGYDTLHALIYAVFGYLLATRGGVFAAAEARLGRRAAWMLPVAALLDLLENHLQLQLLAGPSGAQVAAIPLSALCSAAKWALALAFALWMGWRLSAKLGR